MKQYWNGTRVVNVKTGETVFESSVSMEKALEILDVFADYDCHAEAFIDGNSYANIACQSHLADYYRQESMIGYALSTRIFVDNVREKVLSCGKTLDKVQAFFHYDEDFREAKARLDRIEGVVATTAMGNNWEFILNKNVILSDTNFALLCQINKMVEEGFYYTAGKIRNVPVSIGGTTWTPDIPIESVVKEELEEIFNKQIDDVDKAIELLLYTMKKQIFIDGLELTKYEESEPYLLTKYFISNHERVINELLNKGST